MFPSVVVRPKSLLAVFLLLLALVAGVAGSLSRADSSQDVVAHSPLQQWIGAHPGEAVPIIAQFEGSLDDAETFVRANGGNVEHRLELINALSGSVRPAMLEALDDEPSVVRVTLDAPVVSTGSYKIETRNLVTTFQQTIEAQTLWLAGAAITGNGVGVAVVDTGISDDANCDFATLAENCGARVVAGYATNDDADYAKDGFGHGTHVANTIGGYSYKANGEYAGVAPQANLIGVKIDDDQGNSTVGDVIEGLGWVFDNRTQYNIRVVNLSLSSSVAQSYKVDPLDAAVELLVFNGITVVVAAGNTSNAYSFSPANDPFVITVGATDERGTSSRSDDTLASFSSAGVTLDSVAKPDVVAPGVNIVAGISPSSMIAKTYPGGIVREDNNVARYRMSGTSMATAIASGAAALLIEKHPDWTPGQIKAALVESGSAVTGSSAPQLNVRAAINETPNDASVGMTPSYLLLDAAGACDTTVVPVESCPVVFEKISWGSVEFNKISWSKISWSKVSWSKVSWGGVDYQKISWSKVSWGHVAGQ